MSSLYVRLVWCVASLLPTFPVRHQTRRAQSSLRTDIDIDIYIDIDDRNENIHPLLFVYWVPTCRMGEDQWEDFQQDHLGTKAERPQWWVGVTG